MKHFFNINIILNLVKVETFVHNSSGLSSALNGWFDLLLVACKFKERGYLKAPPTCCSKHLFVRGSQSGGEKTEAFKGEELKWLISVGELKSHTQ